MKKYYPTVVLALAIVVFRAAIVSAGTGGTEFTEIYTTIQGWTQGFLGKVVALGTFLTGMAMGIIRQSLAAIVVGVGAAMGVYYSPNIIDSIVTAQL